MENKNENYIISSEDYYFGISTKKGKVSCLTYKDKYFTSIIEHDLGHAFY